MFEVVATSKSANFPLEHYSRISPGLAQRFGFLILVLVVVLATASCGTLARATGAHAVGSHDSLLLHGSLSGALVNQSYNAVLAVSGGSSPYHFSVKTGALPPGVTLNPNTGAFSGKPTTTGLYQFEVIVTDSPRFEEGIRTFSLVVANGANGGVAVSLTPTNPTLLSNQKQQFTATVSGTSNTGVTWWAMGGSIDATGLYTAPAVTGPTRVDVTAISNADPAEFATAALIVEPGNDQSLQITTGSLPLCQQGNPYIEALTASGGTAPYHWSISQGAPPAGITMNTSGELSGTPAATGTSSFVVTVADATGSTTTGNLSVTVVSSGNFDGPAELPRVTVTSAMADTLSAGDPIFVPAGGNLQAALTSATCGDTIALQAGATFTGTFTFPAKNCDGGHWIVVRTSSPDSALPAEGQRLTPCYAGVASLPGRPQYPCSNPQNVLARLVVPAAIMEGPVIFQSGANNYRLIGLELTRPTGTPGAPTLMMVEQGGTANSIVLDRSWVHGTAEDETRTGIDLVGTNSVAIVDSYFSDFHCTAITGTCTDSHAVSGGMGNHQDGPYAIQNNFLEAAGEAILFGGGEATTTPTDITISFNHFFKPLQWMPGNQPFQGGSSGRPFVVKNHLELKNAARVLAEANLMEDVWGGFTQHGFAIMLTPSNQPSAKTFGLDLCPICVVTDVTIRYTHIAHAGGAVDMATPISGQGADKGGAAAKAGTRYSIHDVVMDDISGSYIGEGRLFYLANSWLANPLNTITINHITGFANEEGGIMFVGNKMANPQMYGFVFTNNLVTTGGYPIWDAQGGDAGCAVKDVPITSLNRCFGTYTFTNNALIAAPSHLTSSSWPAGNLFGSNPNNVGFVAYENGNGGNYELQPTSPYKNMGSDGKDLGADIVGLNAALAGVE